MEKEEHIFSPFLCVLCVLRAGSNLKLFHESPVKRSENILPLSHK